MNMDVSLSLTKLLFCILFFFQENKKINQT